MEKITMNNKELIQATSRACGKTQKDITQILNAMDEVIMQQLSVATPDTSVEVKVLPSGLSLISEYQAAHTARNPMTGETIDVPSKKRVKSKFYSGIKKAVNE